MQNGAARVHGEWSPGRKVSLDRLARERRKLCARLDAIDRRIARETVRVLGPGTSLTPRQIEVLKLVVAGKCNKEIAGEMNLTVRTVKFHVSALLGKFHVADRLQLSVLARAA